MSALLTGTQSLSESHLKLTFARMYVPALVRRTSGDPGSPYTSSYDLHKHGESCRNLQNMLPSFDALCAQSEWGIPTAHSKHLEHLWHSCYHKKGPQSSNLPQLVCAITQPECPVTQPRLYVCCPEPYLSNSTFFSSPLLSGAMVQMMLRRVFHQDSYSSARSPA